MAVHAGDIVLGRAEDIASFPYERSSGKALNWPGLTPRELAATESDSLWPDGVIPYVIDGDITDEQRQGISAAIKQWNDKTVITLVPRASEPNYVRFSNVAAGHCRSNGGMVGGEQVIALPPGGCSANTLVHEIGYAVGLWHEHQREDRDDYVTVRYENLDKRLWHAYLAEHQGGAAYDYASAMHYHPKASSANGESVFETVPPGMNIPSAGLSAGDMDGVARLCGKPLEATLITSSPPGLAVVVDGVRVTTPATFRWAAETTHTLETPVSQTGGETRYLFGQWNDGGQRLRNVTAGSDVTWVEANFDTAVPRWNRSQASRRGKRDSQSAFAG